MDLLIVVVIIAVVIIWSYQFVFLMLMEDALFPGRLDKAIWGAAFLLAAPLAPFVFLLWRRAILSSAKDGKQSCISP
jgi:hypothetical protein